MYLFWPVQVHVPIACAAIEPAACCGQCYKQGRTEKTSCWSNPSPYIQFPVSRDGISREVRRSKSSGTIWGTIWGSIWGTIWGTIWETMSKDMGDIWVTPTSGVNAIASEMVERYAHKFCFQNCPRSLFPQVLHTPPFPKIFWVEVWEKVSNIVGRKS